MPAREKVRIFEVGVRDGLQNEKTVVSTARKLRLAQGLIAAGVRDLELGAFVRPDRVPTMKDTDAIYRATRTGKLKLGKTRAWALVPNEAGIDRALEAGCKNIAVFTAASEGFAKNNIGMSIKRSLQVFRPVIQRAHASGLQVRGYVSTAFGCPFDGKVKPAQALRVIEALLEMDVCQVSVGDTIGVATPAQVEKVLRPALAFSPGRPEFLAGHFHDTRGTALANAVKSLELGIRTLDSSAGGLGGCPFAPSATGNLATEDLVYLLEGMGFQTGIDLDALARTSLTFLRSMGRAPISRALSAFAATGKGYVVPLA